jgi:hypothetical protein
MRPMTVDMERAEAGVVRARRCRWADVGRSAHPDAATAGREAARAALLGHDGARLLLVFASGGYDLPALAAAVDAVAGGIPVAGCSSAGEIDASGAGTGSVVVLALGGDGLSFSTTAVSAIADPRDAGARAAACIGDVADREHRVLLLLTDGTPARQPDIVRGAYSVAGAGVPLVGGMGRLPCRGERPSLICGGKILQDAVIGVAIGSDAPLGVGVRHGWRPVGEPMLVTRATPGRVLELDGRRAADVYRERLGGAGQQPVAITLAHPLGMRRRVDEAHVRCVGDDGAGDGSLSSSVPAGALVWLMESDVAGVQAATDAACREALHGLDGESALALLVLDCDARLRFLGDRVGEEVDRIVAHAGDAAVAGLYTHGEIARTRGSAGFHQQTLVVLAIA